MNRNTLTGAVLLLVCGTSGAAMAAAHPQPSSPAVLLKAERSAMQPLAGMAGVWRGQATMTLRSGKRHTITQTERVGPFLGGSVMVMEGRGYESDGRVSFNALGVVSYQPARKAYTMRAYAQGHAGNFPLQLTDDGFQWDIKAGPTTMHYTATIGNGTWHEVGDRILPGGKSVRFFEMTLTRVGDTDWPAAGAVPFKKPSHP